MMECRYNESEQDIRRMKGLNVDSVTNMKDIRRIPFPMACTLV